MEYADILMPQPMPGQIEIGTVGWEDEDEWYVVGTPGSDEDGYTMVRVQLYRGRDHTKKPKPGVADGHRLLAHISSSIGRIPPKGTRVYVAIPKGYEDSPGAAVIIASVEKNNADQLSQQRAVLDYGSQKLHIKAETITLQANDGCYISMGKDLGVLAQDKDGNMFQMLNGDVFINTTESINLSAGSGGELGGVAISPTETQILCQTNIISMTPTLGNWYGASSLAFIGGSVALGRAPSQPALYGITGVAGVASTSVFVSL